MRVESGDLDPEMPARVRHGGGAARRHLDRGVVGGTDGLIAGILVMVLGTVIVVSVWSVISARVDADAALREYLRAYGHERDAAAADDVGRRAAVESLRASGRDPSTATIVGPDPTTFGPCSSATARVELVAPTIRFPGLVSLGNRAVVAEGSTLVEAWQASNRGDRWRPEATPCFG